MIEQPTQKRDYSATVLATTAHLNEIAILLRKAGDESASPFHNRKLSALANGFERLIPCIERLSQLSNREAIAGP